MLTAELKEKLAANGLTYDEYQRIIEILGRKPNDLELALYGVMWSEHCSYKHSKAQLKTLPTEGECVLQGPGENAGIIDIGGGMAAVFKIESHNHPSAIEPYQGAATGVGGIVRDVFAMGARPIALLDSLRFGDLSDEHVQYLFNGVVAGIADYGNSLGIPTVGGETYFNKSYQGNPLVNAMCVGVMPVSDMVTASASGVGNPVMIVGAATGRDGIKGASFASEELGENSEENRPSVQVGDPFMEKLLMEACLELIKTGAVVGIQDMGAAGLTSSSCEMASRAGTGIELDVALVPAREEGMTPYDFMLSESQERMLVVPKKGREEEVKAIFERWGLNAVVIGKVTDDGNLTIKENGKIVAQLPARSLAHDAPVYHPESRRPAYLDEVEKFDLNQIPLPADEEYNEILFKLISSPNLASKAWIYRQYDHMVRSNTVVLPGSDAAVIRVEGTDRGLAISTDCNSRYCYLNPRRGTMIAVAEAARNVVCSGGKPLAITDGMNFGNPEKPEIFYQFKESIAGMREACLALNTPVTGGNVSFYNECSGKAIYPTPIIGMVGVLENFEDAVTISFKDEGDLIFLIGINKEELGGSEYLSLIYGLETGQVPELDLKLEKAVQQAVLDAIRAKIIKSAHDCAEGGLAVALAECTFEQGLGAVIELDEDKIRPDALLFGETQSRIIVTIEEKDVERFMTICSVNNVPVQRLGRVQGDKLKINNWIEVEVTQLKFRWEEAIPCIMNQR
ncbi:phosphoribosylformylglycinamidine synthase II [Anoxybacter fermentans]|uniref:Phosphoribosylformylglycinamidine synthase subunit PurL n=1 Tax=Anoxybacter fermentans TaxID=1323375 RepID=A0A3S9T0W4_9FIRM|nr:phosphoribosylformylglycinamidine synthase subunit PurL [Anoxybacter fermentans]AZR74233.1 phosphoribosylformylglycinamidine synthase II [Anoxybacter fermentans]